MKKEIEVCFSPAIFASQCRSNQLVVVVDIFRASSAICYALGNGAKEVIPIAEVDVARHYKQQGYLVACERSGLKADFADYSIGPENFTPRVVAGRTLIYSTANGTQTILGAASNGNDVVIGSFLNISALTEWLVNRNSDVIILCSGRKKQFCLEDAVFAGALADKLLASGEFTTKCDSALAAMDLWKVAKGNLLGYIEKASQRARLCAYELDSCIKLCHSVDLVQIIPILKCGKLLPQTSVSLKIVRNI